MSDVQLHMTADQILSYLHEVATELDPTGVQHVIVVVGGALLAVRGLRDSTMDIDSVRRIEPELQKAINSVAHRHGLSPHWVNSAASAFTPDTLEIARCFTLKDHPRLLVLGAPLDQVFVMKLHAARDRDREDLVRLWAAGVFDSPQAAVDAYWNAYPDAAPDEYLVSYVEALAR